MPHREAFAEFSPLARSRAAFHLVGADPLALDNILHNDQVVNHGRLLQPEGDFGSFAGGLRQGLSEPPTDLLPEFLVATPGLARTRSVNHAAAEPGIAADVDDVTETLGSVSRIIKQRIALRFTPLGMPRIQAMGEMLAEAPQTVRAEA